MNASETSRRAGDHTTLPDGDTAPTQTGQFGAYGLSAWVANLCWCNHGMPYHDLNKARTARTACSVSEPVGRKAGRCACKQYVSRTTQPNGEPT